MQYRHDLIQNWIAMRTLEKGLDHHHTKCWTVRMRKANSEKAKADKENAKNPLTCNHSALDLIPQSPDFPLLATPLTLDKVKAALQCMANGKAPGPSGMLLDALKLMVWCDNNAENETENEDAEFLAE
eukprot:13257482-Ditylum_brightwellii.AAC.1